MRIVFIGVEVRNPLLSVEFMPTTGQIALLILGTGRFAEEVADLACETPGIELRGFVEHEDRARCGHPFFENLPVYWKDELAALAQSHQAVCAIGSPRERAEFVELAAAAGMRFASIIHPAARISSRIVGNVGEGTIVNAGVCVGARAEIGRHVILNRGALIGHHTRLGDFTTVAPGANIAGHCIVGERTYIAVGAIVLDNTSIGRRAIVGAGAVVTRDVPDRVQALGIPARIVKENLEGR